MDMKLSIKGLTAGRDCGLGGKMIHFDNFIVSQLYKNGFESIFEWVDIKFCYPPSYILETIKGSEEEFKEWCEYFEFPYIRISKRYKQIEVILYTPELTEFFDNNSETKDVLGLENIPLIIEDKYKNIPETEQILILLNYLIFAGNLINTKLNSEELFNYEIFTNTLNSLKNAVNEDFISKTSESLKKNYREETLKKAILEREKRKNNCLVKDTIIRDVRVFFNKKFIPLDGLYPYDYQYVEIFKNLLRLYNFSAPIYDHFYIQIAKTEEDALIDMFPQIEDWYVYGISAFDYDLYLKSDEKNKEKMVFEAIYNGMLDIIKIDNLDKQLFDNVVDEIKIHGLNTELKFATVENSKYKLEITYFVKSKEEKCPIFFTLMDKKTGDVKKNEVWKLEKQQIYYWLKKISFSKKGVKIKSSNSAEANVWLENLPREMEFSYERLLK
jgi:hypothetical protein